ncbi:MAG: CBS domain-containing protein [Candidatus Aenigmarchaeota archaeon]|nr:CBS domain-containing protein [Candidatus Aenigmarchaeota archaeon]
MIGRRGLYFSRFFPGGRVTAIASRTVPICAAGSPLATAIPHLLTGYRALPVVEKGRLAGMVSATDVLSYLGAGEKHRAFVADRPLEAPVRAVMEPATAIDAAASLRQAFSVFKTHRRGSHPVVARGRVVGMVADRDFLRGLRGTVGVRVEEIMTPRPAHVKESMPIADVANVMVRAGYRRLPVTKGGIVTGIVVPSDLLSHLVAGERFPLHLETAPIAKVMVREVRTIRPGVDVVEAVNAMLRYRVGGLPVTEDHELLGIITGSDVVQAMIA